MASVTSVGQGYNSVKKTVTSDSAVTISRAQQHGATSTSTTHIVTSERALQNCIDKSVSVAVGASWVGGSVSASYAESFAKSCSMTSSSVAVVITTMVRKGEDSVRSWNWKPSKQCPTNTSDLNTFVRLNGDAFITSVTYGASYSCAFVFQTNSQQSSQAVQRQLAVKGIVSGYSVNAKIASSLQQVVQETNTNLYIRQSVTGMSCAHPDPNPSACTAFALRFPSRTVSSPTIICYSWIGYESVIPDMRLFRVVVSNRNLVASIAEREDRLKQIKHKITTIRDIHRMYGYDKDEGAFAVALQQINAEEGALRQRRQHWDNTPGVALPAPPPQTWNKMPYLEVSEVCSPIYGGPGGEDFNDVPAGVKKYVENQNFLKWVRIRSGTMVDQLLVGYAKSGTHVHGGSGGCYQGKTDVGKKSIRSMRVYFNKVCTYLQFSTWSGSYTSGGDPKGDPCNPSVQHTYNVPENCVCIGFRGRRGCLLDAIQMVCVKFHPCTWR